MRYVALGQAGVGAGRARLDATEARIDAAAHRLGVRGLLGVRAEHGADSDCGHGVSFSAPEAEQVDASLVPIFMNHSRHWSELARLVSRELCDTLTADSSW